MIQNEACKIFSRIIVSMYAGCASNSAANESQPSKSSTRY